MRTSTEAARGRITLRRDVLKHLGIKPRGKRQLDLPPDGRASPDADRPNGSFYDLYGILRNTGSDEVLSIDQINDGIAAAGAAAGAGKA